MNVVNLTRMLAEASMSTDKHGQEHLLVVCKGTFRIGRDGKCTIAGDQVPMVYADEHFGKPDTSSIRYESDFAPRKLRSDVIVVGSAHAPNGKPARCVDVSLELGPIRKEIRVYGDRVWTRFPFGLLRPTRPESFVSLPVRYEKAFGGTDKSHKNPKRHVFDTRNLVGVGIHRRLRLVGIAGSPVPNLEKRRIWTRRPRKRLSPQAFGFLSRSCDQRLAFAGTYDQKWLDTQYPFLPLDFDDRYFQGAPPDQTCPHLRGGEKVRLINLTPDGILEFEVPRLSVSVKVIHRDGEQDLTTALDTLIIEPDDARCIAVWRAHAPLTLPLAAIREIWVGTPSSARLRSLETGKPYIDRAQRDYPAKLSELRHEAY